jgi:hypothetical protein
VLPTLAAATNVHNPLKTPARSNIAIGPVLFAKPVNVITLSTTARRIVDMTALPLADANPERSLPEAEINRSAEWWLWARHVGASCIATQKPPFANARFWADSRR